MRKGSFGKIINRGVSMDFQSVVSEYFLNPLLYPDSYPPYNAFNTIVYAALALLSAFLIFKGLKKAGVKFDENFFLSILPFIAFASFLRVIVDAQILPRRVAVLGINFFPFVTPGIYVFGFLVTLACIALSLFLKKRGRNFTKTLGALGIALAITALAVLISLVSKPLYLAPIAFLALLPLLGFELVSGKLGYKPRASSRFLVLGQSLDGAATLVGVSLAGYAEQHVVANAIFSVGTPVLFYLIKVCFAIAAAHYIRKEYSGKDSEEEIYLTLLITLFGMAPGIRDATRIVAGV
jgi:uncharacterized membrane protein